MIDATGCVIELKGNITFHETLRVYQNDWEFWEFHNCRVVVQENDLLITMKQEGEMKNFTIKYDHISTVEASPKMDVPIDFEYQVGRYRFKVVHSMPGDDWYVVDAFQEYFDYSFRIFSVEEGEEKAECIARFLNRQDETVNLLKSLLLFDSMG